MNPGPGDIRATRAANIDEFTQRLLQHPEVRRALRQVELNAKRDAKKPPRPAKNKIDPKAPKLLRNAITQDERISEIAKATQMVMAYFRETSTLLEQRVAGKRHSSKEDRSSFVDGPRAGAADRGRG